MLDLAGCGLANVNVGGALRVRGFNFGRSVMVGLLLFVAGGFDKEVR
jgi:hypothetical protein